MDESQQLHATNLKAAQDELVNLMTLLYMVIQFTIVFPEDLSSVYSQLRMPLALVPSGG